MKLTCKICDDDLGIVQKIDLGPLPFYYGKRNIKYENLISNLQFNAVLEECNNCGLIQQFLDSRLYKKINLIYESESSSQSTSMSKTNMGIERALSFFDNTNFMFHPKSVLEIGCQDGYLLYQLYKNGAKSVCGIEPSPQIPYGEGDFAPKIIQDYFSKRTFPEKKFDTVISLWVFEHIKNPIDFLDGIHTVLKDDGQLILAVPNAENQIKFGDPGMFIYEHLFYFTKHSLNHILKLAKFEIIHINTTRSDIYVTAKKSEDICGNATIKGKDLSLLKNYSNNLNMVIESFNKHTSKFDRVGFWGACPTTINLIKMVDLDDYVIFDSDENKIGTIISGLDVEVKKPTKKNFKKLVDIVCISPLGAQEVLSKHLKTIDFPYFNLFN